MSTPSTAPHKSPTASSFFGYSHALVALHWLMLFGFVAVYASIELRVLFDKGTDAREFMKSLHFMLGLSVLLMVVVRALARYQSPKPEKSRQQSVHLWIDRFAKLGHGALYVLMVGMPLLGWLYLSAAGKPIPFFGFEWPALISPDKALSKDIKELHETLGVAGYWLIGLHATAALGHHYVLKDGLLNRMTFRRQGIA